MKKVLNNLISCHKRQLRFNKINFKILLKFRFSKEGLSRIKLLKVSRIIRRGIEAFKMVRKQFIKSNKTNPSLLQTNKASLSNFKLSIQNRLFSNKMHLSIIKKISLLTDKFRIFLTLGTMKQ